jgi:hypothetical protein
LAMQQVTRTATWDGKKWTLGMMTGMIVSYLRNDSMKRPSRSAVMRN